MKPDLATDRLAALADWLEDFILRSPHDESDLARALACANLLRSAGNGWSPVWPEEQAAVIDGGSAEEPA